MHNDLDKLKIDEPLVLCEIVGDQKTVALLRLNRPKALNALSNELMRQLGEHLKRLDGDKTIGAIVITGSDRAFSAGADLKEVLATVPGSFAAAYQGKLLGNWTAVSETKKPVIAAVNGIAFGGGCELALMCDICYAGDSARFAQPEVNIGTIPGAGGTQRWPRVAGKSLAMEICLSGNQLSALEAKDAGLVSKLFPADQVISEAIKLAEKIAAQSPILVSMIKEVVNAAFETTLHEGLNVERRMFQATFATKDRLEGMTAFAEKRPAKWTNC